MVDEVIEEVRLAWDLGPDLLQAVMALPSVLPRKGSSTTQNLIGEKAQCGDPFTCAVGTTGRCHCWRSESRVC